MPVYEYQCDSCGSVFEKRQQFSDEPLTVHENCGGAVRRLISAPALQFKGSGFYITDYAKGSGPGSKTPSSPKSESSGGSSETKSDSKSSDSSSTTSPSTAASTSTPSDKK